LWRLGRRLGAVVAGCLVGAWPALAFGAAHGWSNVFLPDGDGSALARFGPRFVQFFQVELPISLDLRVEGSLSWINPLAGVALTVVVLGGFGALVVVVARGGAPRCRLPVLTLLLLPFLYALNIDANHVGQGRYVLFGVSMAALLVGVGLENGGLALVRRLRWPRAEFLWVASLGVLALVGAITLAREPGTLIVGLNAPDVPMPTNDVGARTLVLRHHVQDAFADYWIAYRLSFEMDERPIVTPTFYDRNRSLAREVSASRDPAYLFVSSSRTVSGFENWCRGHDVPARVWSDGGFTLAQPSRRVLPAQVGRDVLGGGPAARPANAAGPEPAVSRQAPPVRVARPVRS
jgi:hypothetical protein